MECLFTEAKAVEVLTHREWGSGGWGRVEEVVHLQARLLRGQPGAKAGALLYSLCRSRLTPASV